MDDRMTTEQLRQGWRDKTLTPEQRVEAMVRVFGMPRDRAECEVKQLWKNEIPGIYDKRDE